MSNPLKRLPLVRLEAFLEVFAEAHQKVWRENDSYFFAFPFKFLYPRLVFRRKLHFQAPGIIGLHFKFHTIRPLGFSCSEELLDATQKRAGFPGLQSVELEIGQYNVLVF